MRSIDRISALPTELRCRILGFMPTVDSVKTTVLSKRWNSLWTLIPDLHFDDERDFYYEYDYKDHDPFATFVSRVLYFRESSDIRKLCLNITYSHDITRIEDWILTAVRRHIVELEFGFAVDRARSGVIFKFPECLLMCKSLKYMKLRLSPRQIDIDPPLSGCFPSLKSLHVTVCLLDIGHEPGRKVLETLVSCCSILEDLTLDGILESKFFDEYKLKVCAFELKRLKIIVETTDIFVDFHINAPKLENLHLEKVGLSMYFLMGSTASSIINASIVFRSGFKAAKWPYLSDCVNSLLDQLSNVQCLSLGAHWLTDWYHPPYFLGLKTLRLALYDCQYWRVLVDFLYNSPHLEEIALADITKSAQQRPEDQWIPPFSVPQHTLKNLKTIIIRGFKGRQVEREMIEYLKRNGSVKTLILSEGPR